MIADACLQPRRRPLPLRPNPLPAFACVQLGRLTRGLWLVWEYEGDKVGASVKQAMIFWGEGLPPTRHFSHTTFFFLLGSFTHALCLLQTLAYYLKRRDCEVALAADLGLDAAACPPGGAAAAAMRQVLECLQVRRGRGCSRSVSLAALLHVALNTHPPAYSPPPSTPLHAHTYTPC